jgi:hypothetical protein
MCHSHKRFQIIVSRGQYYKLFTAVITPQAAYFSMILTELCRQRRNYGHKTFYNIGYSIHFENQDNKDISNVGTRFDLQLELGPPPVAALGVVSDHAASAG